MRLRFHFNVMNLRAPHFQTLPLFALLVIMLGAVESSAQTKRNNPTSKLYVVDVTGDSQIDDGAKVQPLAKNDVRSPEGSVIETKEKSSDSFVLSNGTAMYVAPATRFEVKRFLQEPFAPNRNDLDIEPSVSQTFVHLNRGGIGLCTSQLVAGSTMVYQTPQATINIRGRRLMIQSDDEETRVSLLEGDVTVIGDPNKGGEVLKPGQRAIVRRSSPTSPYTVQIEEIPESENAKLDDMVSLACISRRTVYFESVDQNGTSNLVPVRTAAATPATQFTVSPSRINP